MMPISAGYGLVHWYLMKGQREKAMEIFRQVVSGSSWSAFGYITAEIELVKNQNPNKK